MFCQRLHITRLAAFERVQKARRWDWEEKSLEQSRTFVLPYLGSGRIGSSEGLTDASQWFSSWTLRVGCSSGKYCEKLTVHEERGVKINDPRQDESRENKQRRLFVYLWEGSGWNGQSRTWSYGTRCLFQGDYREPLMSDLHSNIRKREIGKHVLYLPKMFMIWRQNSLRGTMHA